MTHLKRQKVPRKWPIPKKGTKYVVRPNFDLDRGIPMLIVLRDILKVAQNRREVKRAIYLKQILVNNRILKNEKNSVLLFDTITIIPSKKHYRLELSEKGKFSVNEIKETQSNSKISKITDKKILKGKKIQLNLSDGRNLISNIKCNVKDSILINFKDKKITKCLPLEEKAKVVVFAGKHTGKQGTIKKLKPERKMASIISKKEDINVLIKQIMVIE